MESEKNVNKRKQEEESEKDISENKKTEFVENIDSNEISSLSDGEENKEETEGMDLYSDFPKTEKEEKNSTQGTSRLSGISEDKINTDTYKNKKNEKKVFYKSKKNKILFRVIWIVFLSLISVLLAGYVMVAMNDMLGLGESDSIMTVDIPEKANANTVAKILKEKGIIKQDFFFELYCTVTKNSKGFVGGTYELSANMDYQILINKMKSHAVDNDVVEVAFREGMNIQECANLLSENGVCEKEDFLEKCKSDDFDEKFEFLKEIKNKNDRVYKLEGYLFPDTYEFYRNEDSSGVIRRFLSNFQKKFIKLNSIEGYEQKTSIKQICEKSGKSLDEIINISSMIQAEAADKSDMYKVSSVIHNRLGTLPSNGLNKFGEYGLSKLGIDSTVWYPYKTKSAVPGNIVGTFRSTYDTYEISGIPPGPVCNPGMQAVYAALSPEKTDYFYFCHSASGSAYYGRTNTEHLENLKKAGLA